MDFFTQQAHAQRQTRLLLVLFMLAVVAIVAAVNLAMALVFLWTAGGSLGNLGYPRGFFLTNTLVTVALIGGGSAIEVLRLREGGDAVARMAGGRLILSTSRQPQERRLQNVVEEMAIASGIACPRIYAMERETAINAFAAGFNQNEAVIAVTRGALERLNRDELQGVVGHEFSHILNGDMRLNMRLIGVLFGIQMIAGFGRQLMETAWVFRSDSRKSDSRSSIWLVGAALYAVGYIGVFFGRLIKSAVSRQREYLADASAVQFTRNPDGIGNALRKIGGLSRAIPLGSQIEHPQAEQLSHFFLCAARPALLAGLFATHPPLDERLRRIYGRNVGLLDAPVLEESHFSVGAVLPDLEYSGAPGAVNAGVGSGTGIGTGFGGGFGSTSAFAGPAATAAGAAQVSERRHVASASQPGHSNTLRPSELPAPIPPMQLPPVLRSALHDPLGAGALVYALLLDDPAQLPAQQALLARVAPQHAPLAAALRALLDRMPGHARLPLLDLAMPALKLNSAPQRQALLSGVAQLIASDRRVTLEEFVLETILARRLAPDAGRMVPVRFASIAPLGAECALLLSLVTNVAANVDRAMAPAVWAADAVATFDAESRTAPGSSTELPQLASAAAAFARAGAVARNLGLPPLAFRPGHAIGFDQVRSALERCNQLAPLAKPALLKMLVAGSVARPCAGADIDVAAPLPLPVADLLSAICTAIDAPMPPAVLASYSAFNWRQQSAT